MWKMQSRLHIPPDAGSIDISILSYVRCISCTGSYRYKHRIAMFAGHSRHRTRHSGSSGVSESLGWRQTAARRRYGWTRLRTFLGILARSLVSSLNPHSNVRENIARLMILCDTEGEGAQTASQPACQPACLPAC